MTCENLNCTYQWINLFSTQAKGSVSVGRKQLKYHLFSEVLNCVDHLFILTLNVVDLAWWAVTNCQKAQTSFSDNAASGKLLSCNKLLNLPRSIFCYGVAVSLNSVQIMFNNFFLLLWKTKHVQTVYRVIANVFENETPLGVVLLQQFSVQFVDIRLAPKQVWSTKHFLFMPFFTINGPLENKWVDTNLE